MSLISYFLWPTAADMPMINYKIATSTYKVVTFSQPPYLTHLLALYTPGRSLRSQDKHLLLEPAVSTVIGSRGFSYAAPSLSNYLPVEIRNSSLFASFKRNAETYYFPVPSRRPAPRHPPPLATARSSDPAFRLTMRALRLIFTPPR